ncbi:MAG TPA: heavy metal translocating P-type ATPase metal-binding domain-containing protein [Acetobacteraceae bacterium]|nr:heavy metal translocating P-type ATPase metal-binding domain-containing protein [Acetobacteraceae bacterium]
MTAEVVRADTLAQATCVHCGEPAPAGHRFCCPGCAAAYEVIQGLGLGRYYRERVLDPAMRAPKPEPGARADLERHVAALDDGARELVLAIDGLQCGACVWLIESVLAREPELLHGRVNMTTRRLRLVWRGQAERAAQLVGRIEALGYRLVPFETSALAAAREAVTRRLLRALAVAGFAAGNVMLIALGTWVGARQGMGAATRDLLHWLSALIAVPAIAYAGRPFFGSALFALRQRRTNMDVPISVGVLLVTGLSLWQTATGGAQTYFESAVMLLFFLLAGRLLDTQARGRAHAAAEELLTLRGGDVVVLGADGTLVRRPQSAIAVGDRILAGLGERIGADGVVEAGESSLDTSLVTGESRPVAVGAGSAVFAGTLNLDAPLTIRVTAAGNGTLLAECVRLIEAAEARRSRFIVLADRVARRYAPLVHLLALGTFLYWVIVGGAPIADALLVGCAVLIITCPCALALAVPLVQVIATGRLFTGGILLKSPTALERLAEVDTVVFDKTGTLTEPELRLAGRPDRDALREAAALAAASRHPLARVLCAAAPPVVPAAGAEEMPGAGIACGAARLGSARFCGVDAGAGEGPELWFVRPAHPPVRFGFIEHLRDDAEATVARLRKLGLRLALLSGDRPESVSRIAAALGIETWQAGLRPRDKVAALEAMQTRGARVLMVGDGLNDGPALAVASVSASPSTAADLSQTVADFVYQGRALAPVAVAISTARRARAVTRQNLALALGYNGLMVPLAMLGFVTPWLAAAAMSVSSAVVMLNSTRLRLARAAA